MILNVSEEPSEYSNVSVLNPIKLKVNFGFYSLVVNVNKPSEDEIVPKSLFIILM